MNHRDDFVQQAERLGHRLVRLEPGEIDIFQMDDGVHNGPGCERCGLTWCHHCERFSWLDRLMPRWMWPLWALKRHGLKPCVPSKPTAAEVAAESDRMAASRTRGDA